MNQNVIYHPLTKAFVKECGWKEFQKTAIAWQTKLIEKNKADLKPNPHQVCVINTDDNRHTYLNLDPTYPGSLGHAEHLLTRNWRVASEVEAENLLKKDIEDQRNAYFKSEAGKKQLNEAMAAQAMKMLVEGQTAKLTETAASPVPASPVPVASVTPPEVPKEDVQVREKISKPKG